MIEFERGLLSKKIIERFAQFKINQHKVPYKNDVFLFFFQSIVHNRKSRLFNPHSPNIKQRDKSHCQIQMKKERLSTTSHSLFFHHRVCSSLMSVPIHSFFTIECVPSLVCSFFFTIECSPSLLSVHLHSLFTIECVPSTRECSPSLIFHHLSLANNLSHLKDR